LTLERVAQRARERTGLFLTERDVERALSALLASDDIWKVVDLSDVPVMALCGILEALREEGLAEVGEGRISLTERGRRLCKDLSIPAAREFKCPSCGGRGTALGPVEEVRESFLRIARTRPEAVQEFDQGYVTEETTLHRVAFMWQRGDLEGKEVIFLGDDDLVSVAAALTRAPKRVVALDIDDRLVDFIKEVSDSEGLGIEVVKHDLREPMPEDLVGRFDTFFTDPTESLKGFKAFVERGLLCLKGPGCAGYFGLTRREASLRKWGEIQRFLYEAGAVVTDLRDDFNDYVNWPYIESMRSWSHLPARRVPGPREVWYRSALFRVEVVEGPRAENRRFEGDIFEDEEAATT